MIAVISSEVKIGPVGRLGRRAALGLLARRAGQAEALDRSFRARRRKSGALFWHARYRGRCVAAAMVLPNPGRFGMLLFSPPAAPNVDVHALGLLLERISREACRQGLAFVQALVLPEARDETALLESGGLTRLARLIYMRLDLLGADRTGADGEGARAAPGQGRWTWLGYDEFDEAELVRTIAATYDGSLDCPALAGTRRMADVVAGHRASGRFDPSLWWLVRCGDSSAGCILANASLMPRVAEIVYVGVVPAFRGRGLGRGMLARAAAQAQDRKDYAVSLAVDSRNAYALALYASMGFKQIFSRLAYITPPRRPPQGPDVEEM